MLPKLVEGWTTQAGWVVDPVIQQRRPMKRRQRQDRSQSRVARVGNLRRQEHVLEVGGRVVGVGPARRIEIRRVVWEQGEREIIDTAKGGGIVGGAGRRKAEACAAEGHAVDDERRAVGRGRPAVGETNDLDGR